MENKVIVTVIDESATVEANNDLAHFTMTVRAKSEVLENATNQVEEKTSMIIKMLDGFKASGLKLDTEVKTSLLNYKLEHREGSEKIPAGFQSINTISFTTVVDSKIDDLYKACLKLDSNMSRPTFSIKDAVTLYEQALQKVSLNVKDKLAKECNLLGVSVDNLRIQNWSFGYEGFLPSLNVNSAQNYYTNNGVRGALSSADHKMSGGNPGLESLAMKIGTTYQELLDPRIDPGVHSVSVAVRVNYVWA